MIGNRKMKKIFLTVFGVFVCVAFPVCAQIDLGVGDFAETSDIKDTQPLSKTQTRKKSFSFFDSAINLFSSNKPTQEVKEINIEELKKKAEKGDVEAQLNLAYLYLYGSDNIAIDYGQALSYYQKAAEQKSPVALNNLGSLYFSGIGTPVNYAKSIEYFDEAARLGSDDAAVNLAIIYLGSDVKGKSKDDLTKVLALLEQAQANNNIAKYLLGYCYFKGIFVKQDYTKAFSLIKAAADAEYDEAQLILADFYINGWGTPKNYNRAVQFLRSAAAQGNAEAMLKLGDILSYGKIYTRDIKAAHIQYNIASVMGVEEAAEKRDELEKNIKIEDLLSIQSEAEDYVPAPSEQTLFIRQTYGNSLKAYIDLNSKLMKKSKLAGD